MTLPTPLTISQVHQNLKARPHPCLDLLPSTLQSWAQHRGVIEDDDLAEFEALVASYAAAIARTGWTAITIEDWILEPDQLDERHDRRAAARIIGLVVAEYHKRLNADWALVALWPRSKDINARRRPLSVFELAACRTVVETAANPDSQTIWGATFVLTEAGACADERPNVRVEDLDLEALTVYLRGNTRTSRARTNPLGTWGLRYLRDQHTYAARRGPNTSMLYPGRHDADHERAASSTGGTITTILRLAGLAGYDASEISGGSIRNTTARRLFTGNPMAAHQFLGGKSIDQTMREIAERPHKPVRNQHRRAA